jgi:hypothetical protein
MPRSFNPAMFSRENILRIITANQYGCDGFLREYQNLVRKYDLILVPTSTPFEIVVRTVDDVIESNKGGNDWRSDYHEPVSPETKEGVLKEILDISFKL